MSLCEFYFAGLRIWLGDRLTCIIGRKNQPFFRIFYPKNLCFFKSIDQIKIENLSVATCIQKQSVSHTRLVTRLTIPVVVDYLCMRRWQWRCVSLWEQSVGPWDRFIRREVMTSSASSNADGMPGWEAWSPSVALQRQILACSASHKGHLAQPSRPKCAPGNSLQIGSPTCEK